MTPGKTIGAPDHGSGSLSSGEGFALVELVNRVLDKGVVVTGEVVLSVGGVDLIYLGLQLLLSSVESLERMENIRPLRARTPGPRPDERSEG